jgi:HEAT repeat protein
MSFYSSKRFFLKIAAAIGLALGILATAGDAFSSSNAVVGFLQEKLGLPKNNVITVLLFVLVIIVLAVLAVVIKNIFMSSRKTFTTDEEKRARKAYLSLMKKDIGNRVKSSIHHARYVDLKLKESNSLISAFHFTLQGIHEEEKIIDSITPLIEGKEFSILLLGAPGAGKTTTVLNCVSHCIEEAVKDESSAIPILINLSKWRKNEGLVNFFRRQKSNAADEELMTMGLDEWVVKTTASLHRSGLNRAIVHSWLQKEKIILFLDGLDEADESIRNLIVDKINAFITHYPTISLLVCSRLADYEALVNTSKVKLKLDSAVTINPLTPQQIKEYLDAAKAPQLQELLDNDEELKEMAKSPLDLSIMALACRYTDFKTVLAQQTHSITKKRVALFDAYVKAMVQREQGKRLPDSHLHDDFMNIPVPEKKLSCLYRYLEWIAKLQSERSISSFSSNKLYDYLSEEEVGDENKVIQPKGYIQTVNGVLLFCSLGLLAALFMPYYPPLILAGYALVITAGYYYISYMRLDNAPETKPFYVTGYVIGWPVIMIVMAILYIPFGFMFSAWEGSIFIVLFVFAVGLMAIVYSIGTLKVQKWFLALRSAPWWKHLIVLAVIALPFLFLSYFKTGNYYQWIFLYMAAALINAAIITDESPAFWDLIGHNAYAISAAIAGFLVFHDAGLMVLLLLQMAMAIALLAFLAKELIYPTLGVFLAAFLGAVTVRFVAPGYSFLIALVAGIALWFYGASLWQKGIHFIGSRILLCRLKVEKKLPWAFRGFLQYCTRTLLLKRSMAEFEFIHRRIRDYFAIRQFLPLLEKAAVADRASAIMQISKLKDASCDVLLEMIDDNDKGIRLECLTGLGEIGTVTAAKSLLEAIKKTSGELNELAIEKLKDIRDIAATPLLLQALDNYPVDSAVFNASLVALADNLKRLSAWQNEAKMKEYVMMPAAKYADKVKLVLENRASPEEKTRVEMILERLKGMKDMKLHKMHFLVHDLYNFTNLELKESMAGHEGMVRIVFPLLCKRDPVLAVEGLLDSRWSFRKYKNLIKLRGGDLRKTKEVIRRIIETNDQHYLPRALAFWEEYPDKQSESIILQKAPGYDLNLKAICLGVLFNQATNKSIPFLLSCLKEEKLTDDVMRALVKFKKSTIIALIRDDNNKAVCHKLIPALAYNQSQKYLDVLMEQLKRDVPAIRKASIIAIGQVGSRQPVPALLDLFHQGDSSNLEALIGTLAALQETSIIPSLPGLFTQYPGLQVSILTALIRLKAKKVILGLYQSLAATGFDPADTNDQLQYYFAAHFAVEGDADLVVELIFHRLSSWYDNYSKVPRVPGTLPIKPATLFTDMLKGKAGPGETSQYEYERKERAVRLKFLETGVLEDLSRNSIFQVADISNETRLILDTIYLYDIPLAEALTLEVFKNKKKEIADIINDQLNRTGDVHQKMLLIASIGVFKKYYVYMVSPFLRHQEDELTPITIQVLGYLKVASALDVFITHLHSSNKQLVQTALDAINMLCQSDRKVVDKLLLLIYKIDYLQILLTLPMYAEVLNQLTFEELMGMSEHENARFRYLATLYISILGHGKALNRLNALLEDNSPTGIDIAWYKHKTVGEGALYALDTIGTPSAKTLADNWRQRQAAIHDGSNR